MNISKAGSTAQSNAKIAIPEILNSQVVIYDQRSTGSKVSVECITEFLIEAYIPPRKHHTARKSYAVEYNLAQSIGIENRVLTVTA